MTSTVLTAAAAALLTAALVQPAPAPAACVRCAWAPPAGPAIEVGSVSELEGAVARARPGDTILLADGRYPLRRTIEIDAANVTLRGRSGNRARVVLHGSGMRSDTVGVAIGVNGRGVTIADLSIRDVKFHAVQVRGERGASNVTLHNVHLLDTGQQLLKGSISNAPIYAEHGLVACSDFSYTTHAPSDYTNGVDILGTRAWTIRDNRFFRIRGPEAGGWAAGPAILAWAGAEDTLVERNVIVDSYRGIALGLDARVGSSSRSVARDYDHLRGIIRDNVIVNRHAWADEAIEANAARSVAIERNTVVVEGRVPWSIAVRFPGAFATISDNVTSRQILMRDGGRATVEGNEILK